MITPSEGSETGKTVIIGYHFGGIKMNFLQKRISLGDLQNKLTLPKIKGQRAISWFRIIDTQ